MTGRHAGAVDAAEATVWAEGLRARALILADQCAFEAGDCDCGDHLFFRELAVFLREIAGAP